MHNIIHRSDDPYHAGCFKVTDDSLLGSPTEVEDIPGYSLQEGNVPSWSLKWF